MTFWPHWTSQALQRFLQSASETPETAVGFEFMQDNRIHVKHADGRYEQIPVFSLKAGNVPKIAQPFFGGRTYGNFGTGVGTERLILRTYCGSIWIYVRKPKKNKFQPPDSRFTSGEFKDDFVVFYKSGL